MRIFQIYLLLICILLVPGCWWKKEGLQTGLVVINVLDKYFYDDCHIQGSINIPLETIDTEIDSIDKSAEVVLYCSNYQCTGSDYAAEKFIKRGFNHVYVYKGGAAEWYQAGLPVEGLCTEPYLSRQVQQADDSSVVPLITKELLAQKMGLSKNVAAGAA